MNYLRNSIVLLVLIGSFYSFDLKADCTLTTAPGTNGRCFLDSGEFECLEREEDTNCIRSTSEEEEEEEGGN